MYLLPMMQFIFKLALLLIGIILAMEKIILPKN